MPQHAARGDASRGAADSGETHLPRTHRMATHHHPHTPPLPPLRRPIRRHRSAVAKLLHRRPPLCFVPLLLLCAVDGWMEVGDVEEVQFLVVPRPAIVSKTLRLLLLRGWWGEMRRGRRVAERILVSSGWYVEARLARCISFCPFFVLSHTISHTDMHNLSYMSCDMNTRPSGQK